MLVQTRDRLRPPKRLKSYRRVRGKETWVDVHCRAQDFTQNRVCTSSPYLDRKGCGWRTVHSRIFWCTHTQWWEETRSQTSRHSTRKVIRSAVARLHSQFTRGSDTSYITSRSSRHSRPFTLVERNKGTERRVLSTKDGCVSSIYTYTSTSTSCRFTRVLGLILSTSTFKTETV